MPEFNVYYTTKVTYLVRVMADSIQDAHDNWMDTAYWIDDEPDPVCEDMDDVDVYVEDGDDDCE